MSKTDELAKLAALRGQGALSEQEFEQLKSELLTGDASGGRSRWARAVVAAVLVAAASVGAFLVLREDGQTASVAATTVDATQQSTTALPSTTTAVEATTTTAPSTIEAFKKRQAEEAERVQMAYRNTYVDSYVKAFQGDLVGRLGDLWAKNEKSPSEVAACSHDAIFEYFNLNTLGVPSDMGAVPRYLVLKCGGYTQVEAKALLGQG